MSKTMSIKEMTEKYLPLLLSDGYPESEARIVLNKIFDEAKQALADCQNQLDLIAKITNEIGHKPNQISPDKPISLLPGLIELAPFEIDIRELMLKTMSHDGSWGRIKPAMRFFELWYDQVAQSERAYIIKRLMESEERANGAHPLTLYSEKIFTLLSIFDQIIYDILRFIENHSQILPVLSTLSTKVPAHLRWLVQKWLPQEEPVKTDKVIPVRHVNNYAGTCVWMAGAHYATLIDKKIEPDIYGDVMLLYVDNTLIGSMKMYRDPSIVGLRTLQDSQGRFPIVTSGVYVTTEEITIQAQEAFNEQGKWARLELERLPLFPMEFIWAQEGSHLFQAGVKDFQMKRIQLENRDNG